MKNTGLAVLTFALVLSSASAQQIVLARAPQGILQPIGAAAQTDSFVLANAGSDRASVTLSPVGPFTVSPSAFALAPGASMTVKITPNAATAPFFTAGSVSVAVAGMLSPLTVPVRIAAVNPPASPVKGSSQTATIVTTGISGVKHQGSWSVANTGNTTLQGILVSDSPWLIPQTDILNIASRSNMPVTFSVDPKRNASAPLGAIPGTLTLLYATGSTPAVDRVNATVIDISRLTVLSSEPPASAPAEVITFLPVVTEPAGVNNDIFFANRGAATLSSDLTLYYTPAGSSGGSSLVANAGSLPPTTTAWFPFAPSTLFNFNNGTGTVQMRSADRNAAAAIARSVSPDGQNVFTTAIPLLRSDRAIPSGGTLVFPGIEKSGGAISDLFVQETAGFAASYTIDFFDASGGVLAGTRTGTIAPFTAVSLRDVAPFDARSARVTNTSTTAAQLSGYATVEDLSTSDEWTIVDATTNSGATTDLLLPVPAGAPENSTYDVWITNSAASPVIVSMGSDIFPVRSRAVRRNPNGASATAQSIQLAAGETKQVPLSGTPYVRIGGPAGVISATGRLTTTVVGKAGAFGTGVPAIPSAYAAGAGDPASHFFRSIDDVTASAPLALLLLETATKPASVRVTVGFSFPAGATLSAHVERSRDFEVGAGQLLTISDVIRAVATSSRDSYGDLLDVAIDVKVIGGDGHILSYLQTVDPVSGDLTLTPGN